jgi:hypothetical protein
VSVLPPVGVTHAFIERLYGVEPNQFAWLQRTWAAEDFYDAAQRLETLTREAEAQQARLEELETLVARQAHLLDAYQGALHRAWTNDRRRILIPEPEAILAHPISGGTEVPQPQAHTPGRVGPVSQHAFMRRLRRR